MITSARRKRVAQTISLIVEKYGEGYQEFAAHLGVCGETVRLWQRGKNIPNRDHVLLLSEVSGLSPKLLADFQAEMECLFTEHEVAQLVKETRKAAARLDKVISRVLRKVG